MRRIELQCQPHLVMRKNTPDSCFVDADFVAGKNRLIAYKLSLQLDPSGGGLLSQGTDSGFDVKLHMVLIVVQSLEPLVQRPGYLPALEVQLKAEPHGACRIMRVDEVVESTQVDLLAAKFGLASVHVAMAQDFVRVAQRVEHGALAGAVAPE